jgi:hypothetical protein
MVELSSTSANNVAMCGYERGRLVCPEIIFCDCGRGLNVSFGIARGFQVNTPLSRREAVP